MACIYNYRKHIFERMDQNTTLYYLENEIKQKYKIICDHTAAYNLIILTFTTTHVFS